MYYSSMADTDVLIDFMIAKAQHYWLSFGVSMYTVQLAQQILPIAHLVAKATLGVCVRGWLQG